MVSSASPCIWAEAEQEWKGQWGDGHCRNEQISSSMGLPQRYYVCLSTKPRCLSPILPQGRVLPLSPVKVLSSKKAGGCSPISWGIAAIDSYQWASLPYPNAICPTVAAGLTSFLHANSLAPLIPSFPGSSYAQLLMKQLLILCLTKDNIKKIWDETQSTCCLQSCTG